MAEIQIATHSNMNRYSEAKLAHVARGHRPFSPSEEAASAAIYDRILRAAGFHAQFRGCSIEKFLIHTRALSEDQIYRHLAFRLGVPFVSYPVKLDLRIDPKDALAAGLAPVRLPDRLNRVDQSAFIYAPQGRKFDWLIEHQSLSLKSAGTRIAITTPSAFRASIRTNLGKDFAERATKLLCETDRKATARSLRSEFWILLLLLFFSTVIMSLTMTPLLWSWVLTALSCFPFFPGLIMKLRALRSTKTPDTASVYLKDKYLPTYTVLVPVYRESRILQQLINALIALDYPTEKLEIKLLIETDDVETLSALKSHLLPPHFDVIICPRETPRTKPRALCIGLAYAAHDLIVVYDAEDIPDPDQLRKAAAVFAQSDKKTACLQASLTIDNLSDSWLTYQFALEYAGLFDVMMKGYANLSYPIPLGGTSNHFRREALEEVLAWDPWNVTEDADLGLRLYRSGYRVKTFNSSTHEEAPAKLRAWINQRTRWLKGWAQTSAVHLRPHKRSLNKLSSYQACKLALVASIPPLSILFHPLLMFVITYLVRSADDTGSPSIGAAFLYMIFIGTCSSSLLLDGIIALRGARARGIKITSLHLLASLPYSLLKTFAGWRALFEIVYAPYHWRKTTHGLAKSSRRLSRKAIRTTS